MPLDRGESDAGVPAWSRGVTAARAWAIVLVVALHAAIPYAVDDVPGLKWHVREPAGHGFDALFWWCYAYATPLFSVLAGFLAAGSLERRGARAFARERVRRLGLPLIVGVVVVLPLAYPVWLRGWTLRGLASPVHLLMGNFAPGAERALWGLGHLWYLEYLLVLCLAWAAWGWARPRLLKPNEEDGSGGHSRAGGVLAMGMIATGALVTAWPGVLLDFRNLFWPDPPKLAYHAVFFVVGAGLWRWRDDAARLTRHRWLWLVAGAGAYFAILAVIRAGRGGLEPWLGLWASLATWGSILWALGAGVHLPARALRLLEPLSRASLTIYVAHLPVLALVQLLLVGVGVSAWVKWGAGVVVTLGVCGFIARWLGPRNSVHRRETPAT
jgi:glucans biosynthesis protein C